MKNTATSTMGQAVFFDFYLNDDRVYSKYRNTTLGPTDNIDNTGFGPGWITNE
jgi:hypothetical protein